jgi:hypothetical protein
MLTLRNILLLMFFSWLCLFAVGATAEDRNPQQSPGVTSATPNTMATPTKTAVSTPPPVSTQPPFAQPHRFGSCDDDWFNIDLAALRGALQYAITERIRAQKRWEQANNNKLDADVIKQSLKAHYESALQQEVLLKNKVEEFKRTANLGVLIELDAIWGRGESRYIIPCWPLWSRKPAPPTIYDLFAMSPSFIQVDPTLWEDSNWPVANGVL